MADNNPPPSSSSNLLFFYFILLPYAASDPDDVLCLTKLYSSLQDPSNNLRNWTRPNLASPCDGFDSHLTGATCNNGRIFKLSLSSFSLSGTISPFLSNCSYLQGLDLSSNLLSGPIPSDLRLLQNLALLNLSNNRLSGPIPSDLSNCTYLNLVDLHNNRLTGPIPLQFGLLARLSTFDVSNNRLQGMIPPSLANRTSTLPRFNASSFQGNKDLYGFPLSPYKGGKGLSLTAIVVIGVGSGLLSLIVSFTVVCVWLRVSERRMAAEEAKMSNLMPDY